MHVVKSPGERLVSWRTRIHMIQGGGCMLQISLSIVCRVPCTPGCPSTQNNTLKVAASLSCRRVFPPLMLRLSCAPTPQARDRGGHTADAPSFSLVHRGAYERTPPGIRLLPRVVTSSGTSSTKTPPSSPCQRDGFVRRIIGKFGVRAQVPREESRTVRVELVPHRENTTMCCSGDR